MARFVVLEHSWNGIHFDLMVQEQDALRTWSVEQWIEPHQTMKAMQRPDHRLVYLDYEGEISGGRGSVRRVAEGTFTRLVWMEDRVVLHLDSTQLNGELRLELGESGGVWSLLFRPGKVD